MITIACDFGLHLFCAKMGARVNEGPMPDGRFRDIGACKCSCNHESSNGRIDDFESFDLGSNPSS